MIDASILGNSQFLGRDGFRWWVGQIPPVDSQEDQVAKGEGVGNRYKAVSYTHLTLPTTPYV